MSADEYLQLLRDAVAHLNGHGRYEPTCEQCREFMKKINEPEERK